MALLSGSYTRLRILDTLPDDWRDRVQGGIDHNRFREQMESRSDEPNVGWTVAGEPGQASTTLNDWLFTSTAVLGIRADAKRVSGKLLKVKVDEQVRAVMAERGVERINSAHKREIKEAVQEDLTARALPSLKTFDLLWDVPSGQVLVFATDDASIAHARALFADTTGVYAYPFRLVDWLGGKHGLEWDAVEAACARITGDRQMGLPIPERYHEDPLKGHVQAIAAEFVLWLWFRSEKDFGSFETPDGPVDVWMDDKIRFAAKEEKEVANAFTGGAPSTTPEAKLSIISGKSITDAKVGMRRGEAEWSFTLKVDDRGPSLASVKLPAVVKDGLAEQVYERWFLIETLHEVVAYLFRRYIEERSGDGWDKVKAQMSSWLLGEEE